MDKVRPARSPRKSSQAVTIRMVAAQAGVSTMTVSNVLNGRKGMADATREAVMEAVRRLNYVPNPAARALASAAAVRIGLFYQNPTSGYLSALMMGALGATTRLGAQLILGHYAPESDGDGAEALAGLRRLQDSGANAILLTAHIAEIVSHALGDRRMAVPLAAVSPGRALPGIMSVHVDNEAAARRMTELLLAQGHRRIGFIAGPASHLASGSRFHGYRAALAAAGIAFDPALVRSGAFAFEAGLDAAQALLAQDPRPTAIFASNDDMAAAVVSTALRQGLRIPEELAVAGFDDAPIATRIWPMLTTVRQPIMQMAELAVEMLAARVRDPAADGQAPAAMELPFHIIERESTAAPR